MHNEKQLSKKFPHRNVLYGLVIVSADLPSIYYAPFWEHVRISFLCPLESVRLCDLLWPMQCGQSDKWYLLVEALRAHA